MTVGILKSHINYLWLLSVDPAKVYDITVLHSIKPWLGGTDSLIWCILSLWTNQRAGLWDRPLQNNAFLLNGIMLTLKHHTLTSGHNLYLTNYFLIHWFVFSEKEKRKGYIKTLWLFEKYIITFQHGNTISFLKKYSSCSIYSLIYLICRRLHSMSQFCCIAPLPKTYLHL